MNCERSVLALSQFAMAAAFAAGTGGTLRATGGASVTRAVGSSVGSGGIPLAIAAATCPAFFCCLGRRGCGRLVCTGRGGCTLAGGGTGRRGAGRGRGGTYGPSIVRVGADT